MSGGEFFHYTTIEGLQGIITQQNLRSTHYKHLNDRSEMLLLEQHFVQFFQQELFQLINSDADRFGGMDEYNRASLAIFESKALFDALMKTGDINHPIFVTSLCRHDDVTQKRSGLLSQWRAYASGTGYCLVLDEDRLVSLLDQENARRSGKGLVAHGLVAYQDTPGSSDLNGLAGVATLLFKRKFSGQCGSANFYIPGARPIRFPDDIETPNLDDAVTVLMSTYAAVLPFHKHVGFQEENEYRVVHLSTVGRLEQIDKGGLDYQFFLRANEMVPYLPLFSVPVSLPVVRVIVGPGSHAERRKHGVQRFLDTLNLPISVETSEIPFV